MAEHTSPGPTVAGPEAVSGPREPTGSPLRLVRGDASPEELAALVAVLAAAGGGVDDDEPSDPHSLAVGRKIQSRWSSPRRMVRTTPPHGQGAWRASARSR
ncbi:MAG: acyl-CoA carboxylase epsilon subunit [Actinomycetota bacterium]